MMTISPAGVGNLGMGSMSASGSKSKEQIEGVDSFASLMDMGSSNATTDVDFESNKDIKSVDNTESINKEAEYASDDTYNKTVEPEKADSPEKVSKVPEDNKYNTDDKDVTVDDLKNIVADNITVEESDITEDELASILVQLQNLIKDILTNSGIVDENVTINEATLGDNAVMIDDSMLEGLLSSEKIQNILSEMGISAEDLLDVSNLKDFILKVNNSTEVDILINEKLANIVNSATEQVENILTEQEVSNVDEFIAKLKIMEAKTEKTSNADTTKIAEGILAEEAEIKSFSDAETVINKSSLADKDIEVNVMKDFSQSSSKGESFGEAKNQILTNLNQAIDSTMNVNSTVEVASFVDNVQEADIIRQIIDNIKLNISKETTSMEIQLNPEHLGKVQINVASKDGILQAQIIAESEAAKNAIEGSLATLKETFQNQELKVEAIEVMVASYEFFNQSNAGDEQNESAPSKRTGVINMGDVVEDELTEEELIEVELMKAKGNSVSYSV